MRETSWIDWPALDADQMREADRVMIEELHVSLLQMMENAGRNLAWLALERFAPSRVVVLAGGGGNGGGGLAAARHLVNHGVDVEVRVLAAELVDATRHQHDILRAMGVDATSPEVPTSGADLVIDAMVGYSLRGDPRGVVADHIAWTATQPAPVLSLDVPSGFDATSGQLRTVHVTATATLTLAAPKTGLDACGAAGEIYVGDISVPPHVYERFGSAVAPRFGGDWVVRVLPAADAAPQHEGVEPR